MIYFSEKEMRGEETESPPWDKRPRRNVVKGIVNNVKMASKMRKIIGSATVSPSSAEKDAKSLFKAFMKMTGKGEGDDRGSGEGEYEGEDMSENKEGPGNEEPSSWESKEEITGDFWRVP